MDKVLTGDCRSVTTGIAAINLERRFVGIEINPEYANLARARLQAERERLPLLKEEETDDCI